MWRDIEICLDKEKGSSMNPTIHKSDIEEKKCCVYSLSFMKSREHISFLLVSDSFISFMVIVSMNEVSNGH